MELFSNNASTTLNGAIGAVTTSVTVTSAVNFPSTGNFRIVVDSEIMLVTNVSGNTFTVTRGVEGTSGASHINGAVVSHVLTSGALSSFRSDNTSSTNDFRLTLTTATPITTSDVTSAGTIYLTPFTGNRISLYDGSLWSLYNSSEVNLSLTLTSGKNYDVFAYNNSGTLTLELSSAWTNDTTRADAIVMQDGIYVKSADHTRRLVGTIRASGTNITEDSLLNRYVWNAYNRVRRPVAVSDSVSTYTATLNGTWRQVNGNSANRVQVVTGLAYSTIELHALLLAQAGNTTNGVGTGIGENSTTAVPTNCIGFITVPNGVYQQSGSSLATIPRMGYSAYNWLEQADATINGFGTRAQSSGVAQIRSGMAGWFEA